MRERIAFRSDRMGEALQSLRGYADEGFIVSTCNRVEVGGLVAGGEHALVQFLSEWHHVAPEDLMPHLYIHSGVDAVRHLFRLAAGLDSMVLGEDQVMVQLKSALAEAQAAGATGQRVNRLMHAALATGKLIRTRTEIARSHLSTVSVALDIARQELGSLAHLNVVLVGAGRIAELALKHLRGDAPRSVVLLNRTFERARDLAEQYGAQARPLDQIEQALGAADVVISCTASPDVVIDAAMVERALHDRLSAIAVPAAPCPHAPQPGHAKLLLLDLAVPRDIDPLAANVPGALLFGIDDMRAICESNRAARESEVTAADHLVEEEVNKFMEWWATQEVVPTIRALRERAETIRQGEIERTLSKLPNLSDREQAAIQALSAAIINKLLHQPIAVLKEGGGDVEMALVVQQLFHLTNLS